MRAAARRLLSASVLLLALAASAFAAAGIDGRWNATMNGPDGPMQVVLDVKAEGEKLNGSLNFAAMGAAPISNGRISGSDVSFDVVLGEGAFTLPFKGKLDGDRLTLRIETPMGAEEIAFARAPAS
jgi:hypothetical protein